MELRSLRAFVAVADRGTVSAAAAGLHVAQPALSRTLQQLESELGVTLFDRARGRLALSAAGRQLLPLARRCLDDAAELQSAASYIAAGRLHDITIAASATTLADVISPFVATLREDDPTPHLRTTEGQDAARAVEGGADLVISAASGVGALDSARVGSFPVWAYVPASHPWAERATVTLEDLGATTVIVPPRGFLARAAIEAAGAAGAALAWSTQVEASDGTVAQALAAAGRGVALVSDDPRFDLHQLPVVDAAGTPLRFDLHAVWDRRHPAAPTLREMAERIAAFTTERYG
ncbi:MULTISPECIES: LysR family transcriptional regulator [unclassified Nocardioides]|uniref:LysR family transcriptional regulator n=1 Tax=unclassified Nocardioides TaxID=2615069 RepID=UPI0009EFA916|nr:MULTISPECIES: LysR family transcriptional regulator [unclassified Nocardioides]GAW51180.1 Putative LysR-family transcriptional regulator [Nocardioides sp. PD653-B2]GAW56908.1 putative LysR-family transcriptional regulator [Nocardioides sp. PD653]